MPCILITISIHTAIQQATIAILTDAPHSKYKRNIRLLKQRDTKEMVTPGTQQLKGLQVRGQRFRREGLPGEKNRDAVPKLGGDFR